MVGERARGLTERSEVTWYGVRSRRSFLREEEEESGILVRKDCSIKVETLRTIGSTAVVAAGRLGVEYQGRSACRISL